MKYQFNLFGWYVGEVEEGARTTSIEPTNKNTSEQVGALRSCWAETGWAEVPYTVPPELPEVVAVPQSVPKRKALQALRINGITEAQIEAAINTIPDELMRDLALIEFRTSQEFERNRDLVNSIGPALGLTTADIDSLFIQADALK